MDNLTHLIHLSDIGIALPIKVDSPNGPVERFMIGIYEEYRDQIFSDAGQGPENS